MSNRPSLITDITTSFGWLLFQSLSSWIKALSCQDDADRHDQVPAWDTKWAFLASFMRSWGNSPFSGTITPFLCTPFTKDFNTAEDIYIVVVPLFSTHQDLVSSFWLQRTLGHQFCLGSIHHCGSTQEHQLTEWHWTILAVFPFPLVDITG